MSDQRPQPESPADPQAIPQAIPQAAPSTSTPQTQTQTQGEQLPAPTPVEMTEMRDTTSALHSTPTASEQATPSFSGPTRTDTSTALVPAEEATSLISSSSPPVPQSIPSPSFFRDRAGSTAIGPSTDSPVVPLKDDPASPRGPALVITLLLTSGARHPFKLDGKYLQKRQVEVEDGNPYNLSVYKLKELILREWRDEWEPKPASPSSIRLISFGKLLDDKAALKDARLSDNSANVLHMTIKPQDFVEEDDGGKAAKASFANATDAEQRSPGCRCVIL